MKSRIAALILLFTTATALAQSAPSRRQELGIDAITVTGTGRVTTTPDRVSFTAGVETQAATVEEAVRLNNERMASLIAALKKAGATDRDIRTMNFNVYPQQVYEPNQRPRITGFQASNSVMVGRQNASEAGRLLTVAVANGANQVSGLTFSVADVDVPRNKGLQLAIGDARSKAHLLANAAGRSLGRAIIIQEGVGSVPPPMPMYARSMAMEAKQADVPVEAGAEEQTYSVTVTFELK